MSENSKPLNIMEIMGYRRSHYHESMDSTSPNDITIPMVDANKQYDSPTITRVTKQFAENLEQLATYIQDNVDTLKSTNLSEYITTDLEEADAMNKIFATAPCVMTSKRTLDLKSCRDFQADKMPKMVKTFFMEDLEKTSKLIIGITEDSIIRYNLTENGEEDLNMHPIGVVLYQIDNSGAETEEDKIKIKCADFADGNELYIYAITNCDIRVFSTAEIRNLRIGEGDLGYSNIVDFKKSFIDDHKRYNDNLVIEDIHRKYKIIDLINEGNFDAFVDRYFKLGDFPQDVLTPASFSEEPVVVSDVGLVTGKYGVYLIHCYSRKPKNVNEFELDENQTLPKKNGKYQKSGSLHIRCLDNKPVKNSFFYENKGTKYFVVLNGWPKSDSDYSNEDYKYRGFTVFKINDGTSASKSYDITDTYTEDFSDALTVPSHGYLTDPDTNAIVNINQILNSQGINGAYVNTLKYKPYVYYDLPSLRNVPVNGFVIRFKGFDQTKRKTVTKYWFVEAMNRELCNVVKAYDRNEFNCFSEYKINAAMYSQKDGTILVDIEDIGLVEGIKMYDTNNNCGFRFRRIKEFGEYNTINDMYVMNRCFVAASEDDVTFMVSGGESKTLKLLKDIKSSVKSIQFSSTYSSSNIFCIGENVEGAREDEDNSRIALIELKYKLDTKKYIDAITQNVGDLISSDFLSKDNAVSKAINTHVKNMHNADSLANKLKEIMQMLNGKSVKQATGFSDNLRMSYIILNYPNNGNDFTYVETDENSTDIYGRTNSKTLNVIPTMVTTMKRNSNAIAYYDTVTDENGHQVLSTNKLVYSTCRLSDNMTKLTINVPSTGTYYVDNILGWSCGSRTGSALSRKNLDDGFIQGEIDKCTTHYQLILNRVFFNIKNILNVTAQYASAPLRIYSNINEFDVRHYGMYDSPVVAPLNMNSLTSAFTYDMSSCSNDELVLSFSLFGGDALQINVLIENYTE